QVNGAEVWGALSTRIESSTDNTPALTPGTRLADLAGAQGKGVQKGVIKISDGTTAANVDLTRADTMQDVVNAINNAGIGAVTASLTTDGIQISGAATDNITVNEIGGGATAADLGIRMPVS